MLETPLYGRFQREDTRLVIAPAEAYYILIRTCAAIGAAMVLAGIFAPILGRPLPLYPGWWVLIGLLVAGASIAAAFSLQSIVFDLRERVYTRRQGPGLFPRVRRGSLANLDAVVAIAEPNSRLMPNGVTYHLVLHWKGNAEPPMVLQSDTRQLVGGQPLNLGAAALLRRGERYALAMGVQYYDNTHFASKCPIPIWS